MGPGSGQDIEHMLGIERAEHRLHAKVQPFSSKEAGLTNAVSPAGSGLIPMYDGCWGLPTAAAGIDGKPALTGTLVTAGTSDGAPPTADSMESLATDPSGCNVP